MTIFEIASSLFFVLNSLGNIPIFIGLLGRFDLKRQRKIILRELLFALVLLLLFNFFGNEILRVLHIDQPVISVAGGILLFIIALSMIFPSDDNVEAVRTEPIIVPLATPIITGPGSITMTMVFAQEVQNHWVMTIAIFCAWIPTLLVLLAASQIKKILGEKGLIACERLGGMLLSLIAVQMLSKGAINIIKASFPNI